ncbi:hypothetical protein B0J13DRAFT_616356 [Dactylonectria estremocensis]|uniref:Uncharacterized protein n=1 Tax=Dactylonectria estremocensis TaxID=1079267 RepID=A0A9P9FEL9_9HYPO|nr:hypothetical protein B0J13DRAFT_616356 [Dactylonectria estremocensis]
MARKNILQCFESAIPEYVGMALEDAPNRTHTSGYKTKEAEPPAFSIPYGRHHYIRRADDLLRERIVYTSIRSHYLATWERTRYLQVEADVSDAAATQLLNPVNLTICAAHRNTEIRCLHQRTLHDVRADVVWCYPSDDDDDNDESLRYFAALEYKRPGAIDEDEFESAELLENETYRQAKDRGYRTMAGDDTDPSLFRGKSCKFLKQATTYANVYETKYVALFDWNFLVLLYMERQDVEEVDVVGGDFCRVTIVRNKAFFRRALLGFLQEAYLASTEPNANLRRN